MRLEAKGPNDQLCNQLLESIGLLIAYLNCISLMYVVQETKGKELSLQIR